MADVRRRRIVTFEPSPAILRMLRMEQRRGKGTKAGTKKQIITRCIIAHLAPKYPKIALGLKK